MSWVSIARNMRGWFSSTSKNVFFIHHQWSNDRLLNMKSQISASTDPIFFKLWWTYWSCMPTMSTKFEENRIGGKKVHEIYNRFRSKINRFSFVTRFENVWVKDSSNLCHKWKSVNFFFEIYCRFQKKFRRPWASWWRFRATNWEKMWKRKWTKGMFIQ